MMLHIPNVLTPEQIARCKDVMTKAKWVDGNVTAGHQSSQVKNNLQLPEDSLEARELGEVVRLALSRSPLFMSAVLPMQVFPPLFNRYDAGMTFGSHVDNAVRTHPHQPIRIPLVLPAEGSDSVKVVPRPGSLSTVSRPPSACASSRPMDRPRPVPPSPRRL